MAPVARAAEICPAKRLFRPRRGRAADRSRCGSGRLRVEAGEFRPCRGAMRAAGKSGTPAAARVDGSGRVDREPRRVRLWRQQRCAAAPLARRIGAPDGGLLVKDAFRRGRGRLQITDPPLTLILCPVMKRAPSEQRKATASAISSGSAIRPSGWRRRAFSNTAGSEK